MFEKIQLRAFQNIPEPSLKIQARRSPTKENTLTMRMYGDIGVDIDGALFNEMVDDIDNYENVELQINSVGGDAWTGVAIYNRLRSLQQPVSVYVDGIAASAAATIAMAGDTITVNPTSTMMIHDTRGGTFGTAEDLQHVAERMNAMTEKMTQIYMEKTGRSREEVRAAMEEEREFHGKAALDFGLATHFASGSKSRHQALGEWINAQS